MDGSASAAARWRGALEAWAIPADILAAAPQSPYGFSVALFERAAEEAMRRRTPTMEAVAAALPTSGGALLDIGCGAGAASLPHAGVAATLIGVDESPDMLAAFAAHATAAGARVLTQVGRWPDVAEDVGVTDVAVARHVAYNVPDLGEFAEAMTAHARQRAVLELTVHHPLHWMNPLWRVIHGVERPDGPTVDDAVAVLAERGLEPIVERWRTPSLLAHASADDLLARTMRLLCVGGERGDEVRAALDAAPPPEQQAVATVWWAGGG